MIKALEAGAERLSVTSCEWRLAGRCERPRYIDLFGRPFQAESAAPVWKDGFAYPSTEVNRFGPQQPYRVHMWVRCRVCETCLRARAREWRYRAQSEIRAAERTWFGTLTLSPSEHLRSANIARRYCRIAGHGDFDALPMTDQFAMRHKVISRWITLYLKRVRKRSGAKFRYLLVAEAHKSGLPHYHYLLHETHPRQRVSWRQLSEPWPHGHMLAKLAGDDGAAPYLCKYLAKSGRARVRASVRYGTCEVQWSPKGLAADAFCERENPPPPKRRGTILGTEQRGDDGNAISSQLQRWSDCEESAGLSTRDRYRSDTISAPKPSGQTSAGSPSADVASKPGTATGGAPPAASADRATQACTGAQNHKGVAFALQRALRIIDGAQVSISTMVDSRAIVECVFRPHGTDEIEPTARRLAPCEWHLPARDCGVSRRSVGYW